MQQTSIEAYRNIQPQIGAKQRTILELLQQHSGILPNRVCGHWAQGLTNMETSFLLGWSINRVTPRVKELRDLGLVKKLETRKCRVTGNNAICWVTKP